MPRVEGRHTLIGTALPADGPSPTLLFHKWQRYDCFVPDHYLDHKGKPQDLEPFEQQETRLPFLEEVAKRAQEAGRRYGEWHGRFDAACDRLGAEKPIVATTGWRMVVGWATNPALEVGLTLEPLYGFPYVPGSAVKGLLHRVAEEELLAAVPDPAEAAAGALPVELAEGLRRALRVRALFGSLHLRPGGEDQPVSALVRLEGWRAAARRAVRRDPSNDEWRRLLALLEVACADAATGALVTCFDAVPAVDCYAQAAPPILEADVLTPHTAGSPNPITFLAVRAGATLELRYRLGSWPAGEPRDDADRERRLCLGGWTADEARAGIRSWMRRGIEEIGLGGKTAAGYGYLFEAGRVPPLPRLLAEPAEEVPKRPEDDLPPAEQEAWRRLPDGIDVDRATNYLEDALKGPPSPVRSAIARRFVQLFRGQLEEWQSATKPSKARRAQRLREALGDEEGGE